MKLLIILFLMVGIIALLYYGIIVVYAGIGSEFAWFWLLLGIGCIVIVLFLRYQIVHGLILPQVVKIIIGGGVLVGLTVFIITESLIIGYANKMPKNKADYMIVLGAKVRGTKITNSLKKRLDKAVQHRKQNPQMKIIVSGGQGDGEDITEAEAMKQYLLLEGIPSSDIILEDKSTNTNENIIYSKEIIEQLCKADGKQITETGILIVTNGFHVYRAVQIAKKQDITNAEGLPAATDNILRVNYYVREVLAVIKDKAVGNIG